MNTELEHSKSASDRGLLNGIGSDNDSHDGANSSHNTPHETHHISPLARLWSLLRAERRDLILVVIYAIGVGLFSLATPLTAMAVVNTAAMATLLQQLIVFCIVLFISLGLSAFLRALKTVVVEYLQQRIFVRVVGDLAYRLPRVDVRAFDREHGPELVNRFFDVLTVQKAGATLLLDGVSIVLQTLIGLILLAVYHQLLLGFDLLLIAGLIVLIFVLGRGGVSTSIRESRAKYAVAGWLEELARHPTAFKVNGGRTLALERADQLTKRYLETRQDHFRVVFRQFCFALGLQVAASTALLGLGGLLVIQEQLTLGQLVAAEIIVTLVVASFAKLGKQLESYYDLLSAAEKLGHLIDLPLERSGKAALPESSKPAALRVRNLTFDYDDHTARPILDDFNLSLAPGERVALMGPNGAGKSTLIDVLFGLRRPRHGHVEIDDFDVRDLSLNSLRDHVAAVKGVEIFEGTILDNVRMGRPEISVADVRQALQAVDLLDAVSKLPDGLATILGTGGQTLSLGQVERLMLARALAGRPRLLVLDETLDSIGSQVRETVLNAVLRPDRPWTILVVTHEDEIARLCDRTVIVKPVGKGGDQ